MHLAILMSNTDESTFAEAHPKDGEKWPALLFPLCPECRFTVYSVKDGEFPADISGYDGAIITGSPASVHDLDPWLPQLFNLIREAVTKGVPLFGACFGHQAIALALGGEVGFNPGGWVLGVTETQVINTAPWMDGPGPLRLHAAHVEQVTRPPEGAKIIMGNAPCPNGGFVIGSRVFTTQYHPEITRDFMMALIDELEGQKPAGVIASARATMSDTAENDRFSRWIVGFFRQAV
jgi:GMP synthase-like glutamine amidotransferase